MEKSGIDVEIKRNGFDVLDLLRTEYKQTREW